MRGARAISIEEFFVGPKQTVLEPDELIRSVSIPVARGPQQFSKVGTRNAMVIAVASFALGLDLENRQVGTGIGSAGPTPLPATEAAGYLCQELEEGDYWEDYRPLPPRTVDRFAELVASAARPIDDVRGTASYRTHSLRVMAGRTLGWAWESAREYRRRPRRGRRLAGREPALRPEGKDGPSRHQKRLRARGMRVVQRLHGR